MPLFSMLCYIYVKLQREVTQMLELKYHQYADDIQMYLSFPFHSLFPFVKVRSAKMVLAGRLALAQSRRKANLPG